MLEILDNILTKMAKLIIKSFKDMVHSFSGGAVKVRNSGIFVNNKTVINGEDVSKVSHIEIKTEGDIVTVDTVGRVEVHGDVKGNVNTMGRVTCHDVRGKVSTMGRVDAKSVQGGISTMGNVNINA